jgi:hypothetical protein
MRPQVDFTKLVSCEEFKGEDAEDTHLLHEMVARGRAYLESFEWCRQIVECFVGDIAIGGVVAVLLFRIEAAREGVDEWLWVVVGDIPPAYFVTDNAPNSAAALDCYIGEMERWVAAVKAGDSVENLIPVETAGGGELLEPTEELADEVARRLRFLDDEILRYHRNDLEASTGPS